MNTRSSSKQTDMNQFLMDKYFTVALNKKKDINARKEEKKEDIDFIDKLSITNSDMDDSKSKSGTKTSKKTVNKSTKSVSNNKSRTKLSNSIKNQPSLVQFELFQNDVKYKRQLNENQKYLEKMNEFKEKMSKRTEKDIADELPSLDLGDNNASNDENDETLSHKSDDEEEKEEDDREKFIKYFETLKRKVPEYQSDSSSIITVSNSQTSLSSQDSDLFIIEDKDNPVEKAIQSARTYVVNNISFDKNDNTPVRISCLKRDQNMEADILKIEKLNMLDDEKIEYLVLRDINYFMNIFIGYEPSWRHEEFKKQTRQSSIELYSNVTFRNFKHDQFVFIVNLFQSIFCKTNSINNKKYEEYIFKVLLPEALIKICMFLYECDKENAEKYLQNARN